MSKEWKYNPDPKVWDGHVVIEVPAYEARASYRAELSKLSEDRHKLVDKAREISRKHVKGCSLVHKETGHVFDDFEDLDDYEISEETYCTLALCVAKGPRLGNVLKTPSE